MNNMDPPIAAMEMLGEASENRVEGDKEHRKLRNWLLWKLGWTLQFHSVKHVKWIFR
jgi:hypothetical protein